MLEVDPTTAANAHRKGKVAKQAMEPSSSDSAARWSWRRASRHERKEAPDFFPLTSSTVSARYEGGGFRRANSNGRCPGQEGTLTSRMIDRPIRPLFPEGFRNEVQGSGLAISR